MQFKEIELSEALRNIGEGNPNKDLYFYRYDDIYPNLLNYSRYEIQAKDIKKRRWFVRIEGEAE